MIKTIKSKILKGFKNRKLNVFLLFLLLSFTILIFTKLSKQYTNTIVFNINKVNVPQEVVILNDSNTTLNITLKTHGFGWLKYYFNKPSINVDFELDAYKTPSKYVWAKTKSYLNNTQFGKQVELLNIKPDTLVFRYDVNMVKKVPVILNSEINFSPGFDVFEAVKTTPDSVIVVGAKELVSKVKKIETDLFKINEVKANIKQSVVLKLPQKSKGLKFSVKQVNVEAQVERFTEGTLKIPVNIINVPEGLSLNYFPKMVNVTYYTSLNNFSNVTPKDFKVVCDFNKVTKAQSFLTPELVKITNTVKNAKINQQRIEFIIKE
jgi:rRNA maturation protein Rpf1